MLEVKYYDRRSFYLCTVCTGNYDMDSGCIGLIGLGKDKDSAKRNVLWQIKQRIKALKELVDEDV